MPLSKLVDLVELMYSETTYDHPTTRDHILDALKACSDVGGLFIEYNDTGEPVGFLASLILNVHPVVGPCRMAAELGFYVHPDYRKSGIAKKLMYRYEDWVKEQACTHSMVSAMNNESFDKVEQLYTSFGYKLVEFSFLKKIDTVN